MAGVSRSVTIVIAYLLKKFKCSLGEVISMLQRRRSKVKWPLCRLTRIRGLLSSWRSMPNRRDSSAISIMRKYHLWRTGHAPEGNRCILGPNKSSQPSLRWQILPERCHIQKLRWKWWKGGLKQSKKLQPIWESREISLLQPLKWSLRLKSRESSLPLSIAPKNAYSPIHLR